MNKNRWRMMLLSGLICLIAFGTAAGKAAALADDDYQQLETFANVLAITQQNSAWPVSTNQLIDQAISGMVESLDPHSEYLYGQRYRDLETATSGVYGGLGIGIRMENGLLTIVSTMKDEPASRMGIQAGDEIIKINDESMQNLTMEEAVERMRGPKGTKVMLTLQRKGLPGTFTVSLVRDVVKIQTVDSKTIDGYAYIRLMTFQENSEAELHRALNTFADHDRGKIKGLLFDLRDNPGGLLDHRLLLDSVL